MPQQIGGHWADAESIPLISMPGRVHLRRAHLRRRCARAAETVKSLIEGHTACDIIMARHVKAFITCTDFMRSSSTGKKGVVWDFCNVTGVWQRDVGGGVNEKLSDALWELHIKEEAAQGNGPDKKIRAFLGQSKNVEPIVKALRSHCLAVSSSEVEEGGTDVRGRVLEILNQTCSIEPGGKAHTKVIAP